MKVLTFRQSLQIVLFLVMALLSKFTQAQIPDTIYVEPYDGSNSIVLGLVGSDGISDVSQDLYVIYEGKYLPNLDKTINSPVDRKFTRDALIDYLTNIIYRNESLNWLDEARLLSRDKLYKVYSNVDGILAGLNSDGYYDIMLGRFSGTFLGVWKIESGGSISYVKLTETGEALPCDEIGEVITNKTAGTFSVKSENRFLLEGLEDIPTIILNRVLSGNQFLDKTMTFVFTKME